MSVCINVPQPAYSLKEERVIDFYLVDILARAKARPLATVYVGNYPQVNAQVLEKIENEQESLGKPRLISLNSMSGRQYLGAPANSDSGLYHVMFATRNEAEIRAVLKMISFCPEGAADPERSR
ncbi:MAG: hypothetical protein IV086_08545 [Hyphomonadaceae bacterium]|nr:MAG: hypothetical protein FD160_3715 [Caulobacteraceae bacterium]MBT9445732.1 hypothetical protein [Hyphomonadaceae bacterium]TPW03367.1 MAG: hypothetical protein FD124_3037 [Alphaproteobacteria bacterium]